MIHKNSSFIQLKPEFYTKMSKEDQTETLLAIAKVVFEV